MFALDSVAENTFMCPEVIRRASDDVVKALYADKSECLRHTQDTLGYTCDDALHLFNDTVRYLRECDTLLAGMQEQLVQDNRRIESLNRGAKLIHQPLGRVLMVIPGNVPLPLAIILPFSFLITGNNVIVVSAHKAKRLTDRLASYIEPVADGRLTVWNGRTLDALDQLVDRNVIDALYYLGSSEHYTSISTRCANTGTLLIYEGQANSAAVVDENFPVDVAAKHLVDAKTLWNGHMCSSPNVMAVHHNVWSQFQSHFHRLAAGYRLRSHAEDLIMPGARKMITLDEEPTHDVPGDSAFVPRLQVVGTLEETWDCELFGPIAFALPYVDLSALSKTLRGSPFQLQLSIFSDSDTVVNRLIQETQFARYCINMVPTFQDPCLPWGGYGLSGNSPVAHFIQKSVRRALIENWTPECQLDYL